MAESGTPSKSIPTADGLSNTKASAALNARDAPGNGAKRGYPLHQKDGLPVFDNNSKISRRDLFGLGAVALASTQLSGQGNVGQWDGPVLFTCFEDDRVSSYQLRAPLLRAVGWTAEKHGRVYGEMVALHPNYTLADVVATVSTLQQRADEALLRLAEGERSA